MTLHARRPSMAASSTLVLLVAASVAAAVNAPQWQEQIQTQLAAMGAAIADRGFVRVMDDRTGSSEQGVSDFLELSLEAGVDYVIVAVCDDDCADLDLALYDPSGAIVDRDNDLDATPALEYVPRAGGTHRVEVAMVSCSSEPCVYGISVYRSGSARDVGQPTTMPAAGTRIERGRLAPGDETLRTGEYRDTYAFDGVQGEQVTLDLRSAEFDPYVIVRSPGGRIQENDDFEGDASRSVITLQLEESGQYDVVVTSYAVGEAGEYTLSIHRTGAGVDERTGRRLWTGALEPGDDTLRTGEFMDIHTFEGTPGQEIVVRATSSDFDPYLIVGGPDADRQENDDISEGSRDAEIRMTLQESGTYRVIVTSYEPNESGRYRVTLEQQQPERSTQQRRDIRTLPLGSSVTGRLEAGDERLEAGEYRDLYAFDAEAGTVVSIDMRSTDFDTYVAVVSPSGDTFGNDDFGGSTGRSRIEQRLPETGRYRVVATSYARDMVGDYELAVSAIGDTTAADASGTRDPSSTGPRQLFGVFVGISDYDGRASDLAYTAEDAHRTANALLQAGLRPENSVVLTDAEATRANVERAVRSVGSRAGPDDLFVFFYSGHGGRVERSGPHPTDPDSLDETLELYDTSIRDDEFSTLLAEIEPGISLLVLDSCFSGGFAKDVVSVPGRMGLFSSEEDVTSSVAAKFRAGGFLAAFIDDAVGKRLADADGDRAVTAIELSQYLYERYRDDVKSTGPDDVVRTSGRNIGYQHLVVDRGSIAAHEVLFPDRPRP